MELDQTTLDARGRPLQEGDEIILNVRGPIYFRVQKIQAALDPNLPANQLFVHVGAFASFLATRGQPNAEFIRVRTAEEAGPSPVKMLEAVPVPSRDQER